MKINTGIIKLDISDHFPIFLIAEKKRITPEGKVQITKRLINIVGKIQNICNLIG